MAAAAGTETCEWMSIVGAARSRFAAGAAMLACRSRTVGGDLTRLMSPSRNIDNLFSTSGRAMTSDTP